MARTQIARIAALSLTLVLSACKSDTTSSANTGDSKARQVPAENSHIERLNPIADKDAPVKIFEEVPGRVVQSNDGTMRIQYVIVPLTTVPVNETFSIQFQVTANDGSALAEVAASHVSIDAGMPEHGHGMNVEPTVTALGHNAFRVDNMLFHMAGRWELYFDITREGVTSRTQDEITLQ